MTLEDLEEWRAAVSRHGDEFVGHINGAMLKEFIALVDEQVAARKAAEANLIHFAVGQTKLRAPWFVRFFRWISQ